MTHQARFHVPEIDGESTGLFELPNGTGTPERRLLLAILERAILDYVGNDRKEIQEAQDWLFDEEKDPFSFSWLCSELDLDPEEISTMIEQMPKRGTKRVAPWYFTKH